MDSSGSVEYSGWDEEVDFVLAVISSVGKDSNIGIIEFDSDAQTIYSMCSVNDCDAITSALNSNNLAGGGTDISNGVNAAVSMLNSCGDDTLANVMIVITDGEGGDPCNIDLTGISTYLVKVGNGINNNAVDCLVEDTSNDIFTSDSFNEINTIIDQVAGSACKNTKECDYSETCKIYGDPHFLTFDGTLHHFQGEGYFDYVKSCIDENGLIPFTISARQEKCRNDFTCITEVIVNIDNVLISYGSDGNAIFKDSNSDARGSYTFTDANSGEIGSYIVSEKQFSVLFDYNGLTAKLKFYYYNKWLKIETTDCLFGSDLNLCGLCGNINNDDSDDFIRCDNLEQVNNTNSHLNKPRSNDKVEEAWANTHEFGHSCCNEELETNYLNVSNPCGEIHLINLI